MAEPSGAGHGFRDKRRKLETPDSPIHALVDNSETILQHSSGPSFKVPGLQLTNHLFKVPLDHTGEMQGEIDLFVREVVSPTQAKRGVPFLLFIQGGGTHQCMLSSGVPGGLG